MSAADSTQIEDINDLLSELEVKIKILIENKDTSSPREVCNTLIEAVDIIGNILNNKNKRFNKLLDFVKEHSH
jgi:signal recognition particle subunit SEC65